MFLPDFWVKVPQYSSKNLVKGLSKCSKLLRARAVTVKAINLIHIRENILLEIMSNPQTNNKQKFKELEKVNEELVQILVFWKYMELPFSNFIYLGEYYYSKIHEDNKNLSSLFPEYKIDDILNPGKSTESLMLDV